MDNVQKPVTYSKSLVHLSNVSIYVNEHLFTNKMLSRFHYNSALC